MMQSFRDLKHKLGYGFFGALALGAIVTMVWQVGADPGQGRLFASDPDHLELIEVRTANGRAFFVRQLGLAAGGLAVDTRDATVDSLYLGEGIAASELYVLDGTTDDLSLVGSTGLGSAATLHGLDFARRDATTDAFSFPATLPNGKAAPGRLLAAVNLNGNATSGGDHLAELDLETGLGDLIGSFGIDGVEALAFDPGGILWASVRPGGGDTAGLYTVDVGSGLATFYSELTNAGPNGPPGAPSGGLTALRFGCDGALYGGTGVAASTAALGGSRGALRGLPPAEGEARGAGGPDEGGRLVTIDAVTGFFTYAGAQAVRAGDLGGFAFEAPCFTLYAPAPGVAAASNTLHLVGATPGRPVRLFASRSTGSSAVTVPGCGVLTLDLANASSRDTAQADVEGEATFEVTIPGGFSGETVYFQAVDRSSCTVTRLGAHRFL